MERDPPSLRRHYCVALGSGMQGDPVGLIVLEGSCLAPESSATFSPVFYIGTPISEQAIPSKNYFLIL